MATKNNGSKATTKSNGNIQDKGLEQFANMMIEKLESFKGNWQKPWFCEGCASWAENMDGRQYNGMNAFILLMVCERYEYSMPVFCTAKCLDRLNGKWEGKKFVKAKDKDGNPLPVVHILKGEKAFPVYINDFCYYHKETDQKIKNEDYDNLSDEEKKAYKKVFWLKQHNVFNISQTNLEEARPEVFAKIQARFGKVEVAERNTTDWFTFPAMDKIISDNLWGGEHKCKINEIHGDQAYYSISKDEIVMPERKQFKDGESFYSNLFHEMAHSTGAECRLNRLKKSESKADYGTEELVAEMTAALVANRYGIVKHIKDDSVAYLSSWIKSIRTTPQFIKKILKDVQHASYMINDAIDKQIELTKVVGEKKVA